MTFKLSTARGTHLSATITCAVVLLVFLAWGCGSDSDNDAPSRLFEQLLDIPVLSEELLSDWRDEGEPGAKLTEVCPSTMDYTVFAEGASPLLRQTGGAEARSGSALFSERGEGPAYAKELFASLPSCAERLLEVWFAVQGELTQDESAEQIGDESITLTSVEQAPSVGAIFFRRDEFVTSIIVIGGTDTSLRQLAVILDRALSRPEGGWELDLIPPGE